jgi:hypothetical protein
MGLSLRLGLPTQTKPQGLHGGHHRGILKPDHGGLRPRNHFFESHEIPLTGTTLDITEREKRTISTQLDQQGKT